MGWGTPFSSLWDSATDTAKAAASAAAQSAASAYDYAKEKADAAYQATKQAAVATYNYVEGKAVEAYNAAKDGARDAIRNIGDKAFDKIGQIGEGFRRAGNAIDSAVARAKAAFGKVKEMFGGKPAALPVQPCPESVTVAQKPDLAKDKAIDGWIMSPQGKGKPCVAIPPGPGALAKARSLAKHPQGGCENKRAPGQAPKEIIYVNGIKTPGNTHCDTLNDIAEQTCANVVGVYNATEGAASDALQTGQDRRLVKQAGSNKAIPESDGRNPAVKTLSNTVFNEVMSGKKPEIWAHSQGGAVTSLALYEANNTVAMFSGEREALAGVKVKSFGSAAPNWVDGPTYEHYVHVDDATPSLFGLGHSGDQDAKSAGKNAKVIRFSGDPEKPDEFKSVNPDKSWMPAFTANHDVKNTYLRMERQQNGGCQ